MLKEFLLITLLSLSLPSFAQSDATISPTEPSNDVSDETTQDPANTPKSATAAPQQAPIKTPSTFNGEGQLGYTTTSGNTDTKNLNGKLALKYKRKRWTHTAGYQTQRTSDANISTVERSIASWQSDYDYNSKQYALMAARYQDEEFSGFSYQRSFTVGHGWHITNTNTSKFDLELGYGHKQSKTDLAEETDEGVARLFTGIRHQISKTTQFTQTILIEATDNNTHSESSTGLKVSISGKLALKVSYDIKHNSTPPLGIEKADKTTSIALVYGL